MTRFPKQTLSLTPKRRITATYDCNGAWCKYLLVMTKRLCGVNRVTLAMCRPLPVYRQLRTWRCAATGAMCHGRAWRSVRYSERSLISIFRLPPRTLNVLKVSLRRSNNAQLGLPSAVMNDDT